MKNDIKLIIHIFASVLIAGCVIIPTPEHSGQILFYGEPGSAIQTAIPKNEIKKLKPGITDREDILLQFGDPTFRLEDDHIFMYCWQRIAGYFIFLDGDTRVWMNTHLLCFEFSDENKLVRLDHLRFNSAYDKQLAVRQCWNILDWKEPALLEWLPPNH